MTEVADIFAMAHDGIIVFALAVGSFFSMVSAVGLLRLPDVYSRLHAVTKATTLGTAGLLVASGVLALGQGSLPFAECLTILFIFLTNPVGGHMIGRAAYLTGIEMRALPVVDELGRAGSNEPTERKR